MVNYEKGLINFKEYLEKEKQETLQHDSLKDLISDMSLNGVSILKLLYDKLQQDGVSEETLNFVGELMEEFYKTAHDIGYVQFITLMLYGNEQEEGDKIE